MVLDRMLKVSVSYLDPRLPQDRFTELHQMIVLATVVSKEFGVEDKADMFVSFPGDLMTSGVGEQLLVEILAIGKHYRTVDMEHFERLSRRIARELYVGDYGTDIVCTGLVEEREGEYPSGLEPIPVYRLKKGTPEADQIEVDTLRKD